MEQEYFQTEGKTLLIVCEEGDTEYEQELLEATRTSVVYVDEPGQITPERLTELELLYNPERVLIEWNGMWNQDDFRLPKDWTVYQQITIVDMSTFELYVKNMKSLLAAMVRNSELIICNRCDGIEDLERYKRMLKSMNTKCEIVFEDEEGEIDELSEEDLPYDLNADVVEIGPGTGLFTRAYLGWLRGANLEFWDLAAIGDDLPGKKRICDAELAVRGMADNSADAIVASASVQWFNSLGRFLAECGRVLRPGGQVVISTFGRSTFHELSGIITPAATYLDADGLARLTPDAMELTMSDDGRTATVDFESASDLLRHMSRTGVNTSSASSGNIAAARSIVRQRITG